MTRYEKEKKLLKALNLKDGDEIIITEKMNYLHEDCFEIVDTGNWIYLVCYDTQYIVEAYYLLLLDWEKVKEHDN